MAEHRWWFESWDRDRDGTPAVTIVDEAHAYWEQREWRQPAPPTDLPHGVGVTDAAAWLRGVWEETTGVTPRRRKGKR